MMAEMAVVELLASDSGVTALVGQRIYQAKLPQRPTLPAVKVLLVDEPTTAHLRGESRARMARIQVDIHTDETSGTDPYGEAVTIAEAIDAAMLNKGEMPFDGGALRIKIPRRLDRRAMPPVEEELRQVMMQLDYAVSSKQIG